MATFYDIKVYDEHDIEQETIRGLDYAQMVAIEQVLMDHKIKFREIKIPVPNFINY